MGKEGDLAFRRLALPVGVKGELWLHSIPGRYRPFPEDRAEIEGRGISTVIRLVSDYETERKSPEYMDGLRSGIFPWTDIHFPIPDFGIPSDIDEFRRLVRKVTKRLGSGERLLLHCAAGIGRTGTVAAAILIGLGLGYAEAIRLVGLAGSYAEDESQITFLKVFSEGGSAT